MKPSPRVPALAVWMALGFFWVTSSPSRGDVILVWASEGDSKDARVEVRGLGRQHGQAVAHGAAEAEEGWAEILAVRVAQPDVRSALLTPPVAGAYRFDGEVLVFEPAFPLEPGLSYRAVFRDPLAPAETTKPMTVEFSLPTPERERTTVVREVYPSADLLPANLLKFYVQFSAPMSRGKIYDHLHLLDAESGREVAIPFLEIDEELWDTTMSRVTLFIDPGRIKRDVKPLEDMGPSLEEGKTYRLVIEDSWKDGRGVALLEGFEKVFRVEAADREAPRIEDWKVEGRPAVGSREPLVVRFSEPMDQALARRVIRVLDGEGHPVAGEVDLAEHEQVWRFMPDESWKAGRHRLSASTVLEDRAGNQLGKVFEVDLFEEIDDQSRPKKRWFDLPFEIE